MPHETCTDKGRDADRIVAIEKNSSDKVKSRCKQLHSNKKSFIDAIEEKLMGKGYSRCLIK